MKHIKLRCHLTAFKEEALLEILEQTHRGSDFGYDGETIFYHQGIKLCSETYPAIYDGSELYLRGHETTKDFMRIRIASSLWPRIKEAVEEYNRAFSE